MMSMELDEVAITASLPARVAVTRPVMVLPSMLAGTTYVDWLAPRIAAPSAYH